MWLGALSLGFLGSLHCVGMCAPLAMMISSRDRASLLIRRLLYNTGRIVTYGVLGTLAGFAGEGIRWVNAQSVISIFIGGLLIVTATVPVAVKWNPFPTNKWLALKRGIQVQLKLKGPLPAVLTGMLNGLLPCGLVYVALSFSLVQTGIWEQTTFMLWFGLGTLPAMLVAVYAGDFVTSRWQVNWSRARVVVMIALGSLLIARGMLHSNHGVIDHGVTECFSPAAMR